MWDRSIMMAENLKMGKNCVKHFLNGVKLMNFVKWGKKCQKLEFTLFELEQCLGHSKITCAL